jgi:hypothetical protein
LRASYIPWSAWHSAKLSVYTTNAESLNPPSAVDVVLVVLSPIRPSSDQRHLAIVRRALHSPESRQLTCSGSVPRYTYSGRLCFCRPEKKSDFKIVCADRIAPDRLATTCETSSGSCIVLSAKRRLSQHHWNMALTAMPSAGSILSIGVRPLRPPCSSSVSRVLNTARYELTMCPRISCAALDSPGRCLTNDSKEYGLSSSGSVSSRYAWKMSRWKYRRR